MHCLHSGVYCQDEAEVQPHQLGQPSGWEIELMGLALDPLQSLTYRRELNGTLHMQ